MSGIVYAAEQKNITVTVSCPENLYLCHDSKWTAEALFNLLDHAVKYTPPGGSIRVSVECGEIQNFMDLVVNMLGFKDKLKNMKNQSPEDSSSVWRSPGH